jgi:hypothetical protein
MALTVSQVIQDQYRMNAAKDTLKININADLLPPVVAMHAPCVIGLQDHAISSARDEESTSFAFSNGKESPFVPMHAWSCY